jgi:type IV pilus assembly protein PilV
MIAATALPQRQSGAYLLEALIGILIFGLGILGIVGLQAASLRATSDAGLRAEAVFAANQYIGQMWTDDESALIANYSSTIGTGQPYQNLITQLQAAFGAAYDPGKPPTVLFDNQGVPPPTPTSHYVEVVITWRTCQTAGGPCGSSQDDYHTFSTAAVIGQNQW